MPPAADRLLSGRFLLMCCFSATVFLTIFQLVPTAPLHILERGGTQAEAGLFLGFLTYSSALSAIVTGGLADRLGRRRVMAGTSLVIAGFTLVYAFTPDYRLHLALVLVHGVFWSALLAASAAYVNDLLPASRRTEGLAYWGLGSTLALAAAPSLGFFLFARVGWTGICVESALLSLAMAAIAWTLPESRAAGEGGGLRVEWRVLAVSGTVFLLTYGYGSLTSFVGLHARQHGVPEGLFFTVFALTLAITRPLLGRQADRLGPRRLIPAFLLVSVAGLTVLAASTGAASLVGAALVFGTGYGTAYTAFFSHVMAQVPAERRGAAFGAVLAAFDTGIGSGSILTGVVATHCGIPAGFALAALLAALALPYFLFADARWLSPGLARTR